MEKDKAPSRRTTVIDKDNMGLMNMSGRLVWDQGSREHSGPQVSRERTDLNSEEGMLVDAQEPENLWGKQAIRLSGDQVTDTLGTNLQRKAIPGGVNGLNGMLAPGRSRELLDWDSLEGNNGRPAPVGKRGDTDYDGKTRFSILHKTKYIVQELCSEQSKAEQLILICPQKPENLSALKLIQ